MVFTEFSFAGGGHVPRADLSPGQRWTLTAGAVLLHGLVAIAVWHSSTLPAIPPDPAPLMVSLITDGAVQLAPPAPPTVEPPKPVPAPKPVAKAPQKAPPPVLAANRAPEPQDMQVPVAAPEPRPAPAVTTPTPVQNTPTVAATSAASTAPSTEPAVPPPPKTLPSSAVRFLIKPQPVYSPASLELGESGTVTMLILVDENGRAKEVKVTKSSGYPRLDRAAVAAENAARFQPYLEAGVPRSVWVPHSITFNLEER
ncbi:MAG: energy transducer TonB [Aquabacterium sp.]|uniref:energy transducer TonB n=1 Tax=Aquabacterium sp. TaxID=1872578 RepID=UPI002724DBEC|nr:energy transducer TonB [Aquabacterium sp.]MDO9001916.1 energy transducer TonB [Aquabacterium sp.]